MILVSRTSVSLLLSFVPQVLNFTPKNYQRDLSVVWAVKNNINKPHEKPPAQPIQDRRKTLSRYSFFQHKLFLNLRLRAFKLLREPNDCSKSLTHKS